MARKTIKYKLDLRSTLIERDNPVPKVFTNDKHSVAIEFEVKDMLPMDLAGAEASVLLFMKDGSFFQNGNEDVTLSGNVFTYILKENEGQHAGMAEVQLVVTLDGKEYASQLYKFEIMEGLGNKAVTEVMVNDWNKLTKEARDYLDELDLSTKEVRELTETGFIELKMDEKLQELESTYANRLLSTEQQLAQTEGRLDNLLINGTPTDGNSMLLDGAVNSKGVNEGSVGVNIRKTQSGELIESGAISIDKTSFIKEGKNKFNKNDAIDGMAVQWSDGSTFVNANYFLWSKEITNQTHITISGQSNITWVTREKDGTFVRGQNITQNPLTIVLNENESIIEISAGISRKDQIQVEYGNVATNYEDYKVSIDGISISSGSNNFQRVLTVSQHGDGEYSTVQSAVNSSSDGDVILIYPGIYTETIDMRTKEITMLGIDKYRCVIKSTSSDYYTPTIEAAKGVIRNLTIYCERPQGAVWDGTSLLAYAMHIDFAESIGKKLEIEDCIIKSGWNSVLGIGLQNNSVLTLRNNIIIQYGNLNNVPTKGAVYAHNTNNSNAEFIMDNNRIVVDVGNVMNIDEVYSESNGITKCTFINNNFLSNTKGIEDILLLKPAIGNAFTGKTIYKTANSFGNNVPILNN